MFQAVGATEELVYVAQADSSRRVQTAARKALTSLSKLSSLALYPDYSTCLGIRLLTVICTLQI